MSNSAGPKITKDGLVLDFDAANTKSYPAGQDLYVNNVSLMLAMDGSDGSTIFTDNSANALAVTATNSTISTTQAKYGGSSASFTGSASNLVVPSSTLFNFGAGDFTIECWIYWLGGGGSPGTIFSTAFPTDSQGVFIGLLSSGAFNYLAGNGTWAFNSTTTSNALSANQWYHIAYVRSGSTFTVYINGVASGSTTSSPTLTNTNNQAVIGGRNVFGQYFRGFIDDLRITKGISRYNANFTPPTAPFSLPGRITDLTKNKYLSNLISGPTFTSSNGGAINLSGSASQYLTVNGGMPSGISTGFTFECWVRVTDLASRRVIIETEPGNNVSVGLSILVGTTGAVECAEYQYKEETRYQICITASGTVVSGAWTHITVSRTTGNLYTIYINGVSKATGTRAFTINPTTAIGYAEENLPPNLNFKGGMSIIRNYNRTLTSTEVYNNFVANRARFGY